MNPFRFLPTIATLLLAAGMLGLVGCSSAESDESSSSTALHTVSLNGLSINRARIEENRLEVRGETPGREDTVSIRILDQNGVSIFARNDTADDNEYRIRRRPAPVPSCVAEVSLNGTTLTHDVDNRPDICDQAPTPPIPQPAEGVSINSTSQNGTPLEPVAEQPFTGQVAFNIFASNDLGMHCGDLDTRISSILPPFNTVHSQVIQRGNEPSILSAADNVEVVYSAASNPNDPILTGVNSAGSGPVASSMLADGSVYKTNFWDIARDAYNAFYPPGILPAFYPAGTNILDLGLPMPDVERLYLGDGGLSAEQQEMPGRFGPFTSNDPLAFKFFVTDQPFFINFPFGYTKTEVNWFEAAGIPLTAYDDFGRENPWPLMRVQAKRPGVNGAILASLDTVLPISGEANCGFCHNDPVDGGNGAATDSLATVALSTDDPLHESLSVPNDVSLEWAADVNLLRLHDQKHGTSMIAGTTLDGGTTPFKPIVCQSCHYTPALDLAQLGPLGPEFDPNGFGNGRDQIKHRSMSNVMHRHHGTVTDAAGNLLFPEMPPAVNPDGTLRQETDSFDPVTGELLVKGSRTILMETCYQCHPGRRTDCLRGAMANGGMLCQDCHGNMEQVGSDFTNNVQPLLSADGTMGPGKFNLGPDFYTNPDTPRVPWANEPGCGSCHTGDVLDNMVGTPNTLADPEDGIRLMQAFRTNDPKATPIVPANKRFAENTVTGGPAAGNPMLYRVSTGHGGVFCEGCHGATHGIWPNKNPNANDNVAAVQLQGHTGTITECSACHTGDLGNTLDGPHGMHPVGTAGQDFADGGHEDMADDNPDACRACHGNNGEGTVLSRTAADRDFRGMEDGGLVARGTPVTCSMCHDNEL